MTNTLTKPRYQGRTYEATLADGRKVAITVPQGYGPDGGEVARLHDAAIARYGTTVAGCLMPVLDSGRGSGRVNRWWQVELIRQFTRVDYGWDGSPDCYTDWERDYVLVEAPCALWAYSDAAVEKAVASGWQVAAIASSQGPRKSEFVPF